MNKNTLKILYQAFVLVFILPAIVFWVIFAFAGYSLGDFLSIFGFFLDGYRAASVESKDTFIKGIIIFTAVFTAFVMLIIFIIKSIREEANGTDV
ncbi:MAG: hypothetical protein O2970_11835 [Proteobacteria bacterium]|nr:hypothetical protein [Pseudomonadota bacterium]